MQSVPPDFESLIQTHGAAVFGYLWRLLRDEADAEDCLQETYLRAYRAYPRLLARGHANLTAWLYRIATNTARTHLRQRARAAKGNAKGKGKGKKVDGDGEEDERWKLGVQARFMRALHELDYLGFIKHTSRGGGGRKGEYVLRTVLGVLE